MLRSLRAILKPFAIQAAYSPIETIVFFAIIGTLAYFHILNVIKHSSFFAPTTFAPLRPAHAILRHGNWVPVREHVWTHRNPHVVPLEVQQLVFTLDPPPDSLAHTTPSIDTLVSNITSSLALSSGFSHIANTPPTITQTLSFPPAVRETVLSLLATDRFRILPGGASSGSVIGDTNSPKWMAYAARALVMRFYTLAQKADSLDILLILMGYMLMHVTFYLLIVRSRALGSNFWLPCAIMSSSVLALVLSLPFAMALNIPIDPVALTEALPFLVCTVGFDKPLRLARAVFLHPHLTTPPVALSSLPAQALPLKPAAKILTESLSLTYPPILRDYILEIAVLVIGANSKVAGLKEVCALAALLLAVDCLLMCTYLVAVLGIMIEVPSPTFPPSFPDTFQVHRIKTVRALTKTRSRSNSISSVSSPFHSLPGTPRTLSGRPSAMVQPPPTPTLRERLFGVKGGSIAGQGKSSKDKSKDENPVTRLKLLLIATFVTLHILNLCTPLAGSSRLSLHPPVSGTLSMTGRADAVKKVDITEPGISTVLELIAKADGDEELVVKVSPPVWVRVLLPGPGQGSRTSSQKLDRFMSSWTRLVGDPVMSKWIVVFLAISISLNGFLLKGIAAGTGNVLHLIGKSSGVRFEAPGETQPESKKEDASGVPTFTLEDVDRRLKDRQLVPSSAASSPRVTPSISRKPSELHLSPLHIPSPPPPRGPTRPLAECIEIYESAESKRNTLAKLSDEEVILLAQNGKVAAYALEKLLSGGENGLPELERAVRIRRALICEFLYLVSWFLTETVQSSGVEYPNTGRLGCPNDQL